MKNPLLIAFRAGTTIMTMVFLLNWLVAPGELSLENSREWDADAHLFIEKAGRVFLLLSSSSGRRVKVNCEHYAALCAHVRTAGTKQLRVWTDELGYFSSTSLIQARVADSDIVSLQSQQAGYEAGATQRNAPLVAFFALMMLAWRWPKIARRFRPKNSG